MSMKKIISYLRRDQPNATGLNVALAAACAVIVWKTRRQIK